MSLHLTQSKIYRCCIVCEYGGIACGIETLIEALFDTGAHMH